jgi:putative hydrolase of the HAD superfamily
MTGGDVVDLQVVVFDFGQVLTDHDVLRGLLTGYDRQLGWAEGTLHQRLYEGAWWEKVSRGEVSEEAYFQAVAGEVIPQLPAIFAGLQAGCFALEPLRPEVVQLAQRLAQEYRLALLSNAQVSLRQQLERWPHILSLFDEVVISAEVGMRKPEPRIYRLAVERLGIDPGAVLFIDDKPRNVMVAQDEGLRAIVFESASQLKQALREQGVLVE